MGQARKYTQEYKGEAVELVVSSGPSDSRNCLGGVAAMGGLRAANAQLRGLPAKRDARIAEQAVENMVLRECSRCFSRRSRTLRRR